MDKISQQFAQLIKQKLQQHLKKIILFGSRARGDFNEGSALVFVSVNCTQHSPRTKAPGLSLCGSC